MKEVKRWQCEHCKKTFSKNLYALRHELACWANPSMQACRTCKHQKDITHPIRENHVLLKGWTCEIDAGDGNNERFCPRWTRR